MKAILKAKLKEGVRPIKVSEDFFQHLIELMEERVELYFAKAREVVRIDPKARESTAHYLTEIDKTLQRNLLTKPINFTNVRGEQATLHNFTVGVDKGDENASGEVEKGNVINTLRLYLPDTPLIDYADDSQDLEETYKYMLEMTLKHELRHLVDIYSMEDYAEPDEEPDRYYSQNMELRAYMADFHDKLDDYLDEKSFEEIKNIRQEGLFKHLVRIGFALDDVNLSFKNLIKSISKDKKPYKQRKKLLKPLAMLFSQKYEEKSP